ncbi:sensor histidine kinase [Nocardia fluminea]|uniref:sensor histidine kinase n=1 Tax=Nocardia fluminea TaxID=134984 RepID=UPI00343E055D
MLAIALVPAVTLLAGGAGFVGLQIDDGLAARRWSERVSLQIDLTLDLIADLQTERTASLRALVGDAEALATLPARRMETDANLKQLSEVAALLTELNPAAMDSARLFEALMSQISPLRRTVDSGQATSTDIDDFYTRLVGTAPIGIVDTAKTAPQGRTAADEIVVADLIRAADLHSRAVGRAWVALTSEVTMTPADRQLYARLVGAFHSRLDAAVEQVSGVDKARFDKLVLSNEWRAMTAAEDSLTLVGRLPVEFGEWSRVQEIVSAELQALVRSHFRNSEQAAKESAEAQLRRSIVVGTGVLLMALATSVVAMRLANRLIRRLRSLRARTVEMTEITLPSILERLDDGRAVDVDAELALADDGADEIGDVARAFNNAQRTAFAAAAAEVRTRSGVNRVFSDIARRSQVVVHQQLKVLDVAEAKQNDPEHLELLFQLDHLATRARRNAENLLILGGGQPGRRWRQPVSVEEIVRSAISETKDFTRVSAVRLPEVHVAGAAVADLIHLLAELIDNATAFSPPDSPVTVRGNLVGKGLVIEVEDQGLGIRFEDRERLNQVLREPSGFQQMALTGHRNLGLFVVGHLAGRHGIGVNLLESAYGGVKAIALLADTLLVDGGGGISDMPDSPGSLNRSDPHATPPLAVDHVPQWTEIGEKSNGAAPPFEVQRTDSLLPYPPITARQEIGRAVRVPPALGKTPLPRRERLTNLAPQLRLTDNGAEAEAPSRGAARGRSADEVRNSMTAFQSGTRQGRGSGRGPT